MSGRRREEATPEDLVVLDNGMVFAEGQDALEHLWFHLEEREDGRRYDLWRVVALRVLRYLPQEARQEPGLVERMRAVLTGLYNQRIARYDLVELKAGIFDPPLGVLQMYGAVGLGEDLETARRHALLGMAAVQGSMANFEQSRLEPLTVQLAEWMRRALAEFPHALVVIGQPEPRMGARGMGREGPGEMSRSPVGADGQRPVFTQQQAEMLCRALAAVQEEFLVVTLASRLAQGDLARMLAGVAAEASVPASQMSGSEAISTGIAIPFTLAQSLGQNVATAYGQQQGRAVSDGVSDSDVTSHVEGTATTVGHAVTEGTAHTEGVASTSGGSRATTVTVTDGTAHTAGTAHTTGRATSVGTAHTSGVTVTDGSSVAEGSSWSMGEGVAHEHGGSMMFNLNWGRGRTHTEGTADSTGHAESTGTNQTDTVGVASTTGVNVGQQWNSQVGAIIADIGGVSTIGGSLSVTDSASHSQGQQQSTADSSQHTDSSSDATSAQAGGGFSAQNSWGTTNSTNWSRGGSMVVGASHAVSVSSADTTSRSVTDSTADTTSAADTISQSVSRSAASSTFSSVTHSSADTISHAETTSWARTTSTADGTAHGVGRSHGVTRSSGTTVGRSLGLMNATGLGVAAMPSFGLTRAYQWWNDPAIQMATILRAQEELLRQATLEGAWLADVYVLTRSERGAAAAEVAVRQAFQGAGPLVVTPVQTRQLSGAEQEYIRHHAMAFTPSTRQERIAGALEAYRDSTLLLPLQLAAYTAPVLFEEGLSVTTQERIPPFAFVPDMPGDVLLAHLWSTERAEITGASLRISQERFFHTVFAADTGYGKTVAAERLVVETTRQWHYRTVVLDFGAGWRRLLNAPLGEPGRVEVWQLFPGAAVPFRWNPWQVGKRIQPERQYVATCEIFKNAGRMGPRQLGFMRRAARQLYLERGVLTSDREVWASPDWNQVRDGDEEEAVNQARRERGLAEAARRQARLSDLDGFERQALAVYRSRAVDMTAWVERLASYKPELERKRDQASLQSLEGVLLRLEPFTQGEMARMYGSGKGTVPVEELGLLGLAPGGVEEVEDDRWGISILEGGAELEEYAKAALLGLVAWHLYNDAVVQRRQEIGRKPGPVLQIVFEEANKVLTGVETEGGEKESGGPGRTTELFQAMWRDGRKYRIFLHPLVQTVSDLPSGILSSCNNAFFSQTKNPKDRDLMMAHLAFSEKGFTDEDYKRFISRMPAGMAICKLGYSQEIAHTTPFLCRPILVPAQEPTDEEIMALHQAVRTTRRSRQ